MGKGKAEPSDYLNITLILLCPFVLLGLELFGYGIAKIVMGSLYIHDCKLENLVPIYLIVSGVSPVLYVGFCRKDRGGEGHPCGPGTVCGLVGFLFLALVTMELRAL